MVKRTAVLLLVLCVCWSVVRGQGPIEGENLKEQMQRLPPLEPHDALKSFTVQKGFSLQLVASEPLLSDPVDACFDARGRLYVAEMHGYPYSEEVRQQQPEPLGKKDACLVRLLEDTNGDGVFDKSTVFASGFSWATSVCCYDDGVFVLAPGKLYYFKDTTGDGVADVQEVVAEGFSRANVQGLANNMKWGLDARIYAASGTNGGDLVVGGKEAGSLRGRDFCFNPRTRQFSFLTGGQQFGHSFDDWGHRYVCSNSNHIQEVIYPLEALERADGISVSGPIRSIAAEGPAAPVFRQSPAEPWRIVRTKRRATDPGYSSRLPATELVATGFFTSATGVTIYRGNGYPEEFQGNAFIGDVGGNLVHRKILRENGVAEIASRADQDVEFITSTDTWFRPVNFVNGPDGCLYILDMYRETIEHPVSIPEDIKAYLNLESGDQKGRIYRLVPQDWSSKPVEKLAEWPSSELVQALASSNAWHRETAARLLWERQDRTVADDLRKLLESCEFSLGRLHALYTLHNLGLITESDVAKGLNDADPRVVVHAIDRARPFLKNPDNTLSKNLLPLAGRENVRVQFALALALADLPEQKRMPLWVALASHSRLNPDVSTALMLALPGDLSKLFQDLLTATASSGSYPPLVRDLARRLGKSSQDAETTSALRFVLTQKLSLSQQMTLLTEIATGLRLRQKDLSKFVSDNIGKSESEQKSFQRILAQAAELAGAATDASPEVTSAVSLLGYAPWETARDALDQLISPTVSPGLQTQAVSALSRHAGTESLDLLLAKWSTLSPQVKREGVELGLVDPQRTMKLLDAVSASQVLPSDIAIDQWSRLTQHPRPQVRELAEKLNSSRGSADRKAVIEQYAHATQPAGDLAHGKELFIKNCAICHRAGTTGHAVGPDINSVRNKSADDLLIAILDPNREAQPNFTSYTAALVDGRIVTGIISAETAQSVTLRQAEGKEETIARADIEALKSNGVSLMPVGLEKTITPEQLAEIIHFVKMGDY